jgi:BirA family biotin operon repressor/biotin-[acetyl-CoA-carboxylase] ligase
MVLPSFPLLRLLADGRFHSGEELGRALGLTRSAVWHRMKAFEAMGVRLFKVQGRGYKLAGPLDLLEADRLAGLQRMSPPLHVQVRDQCASTNTLLMERAAQGAPHGSVEVCEHQSAGRGRRGNSWFSVLGGSLTFSMLWRFPRGAGTLGGLSLAVAVSVAQALEQQGATEVRLKWPNDLLCGGKKLGGILIELSGDYLGPSAVVIGIGLNVRLGSALSDRLDVPVTDLAACGVGAGSRTELLMALLESLSSGLQRFERDGFAPFRDAWMERHAWHGRRVALSVADRRVAEGEVCGIAEDGALMLRSQHGIERFHSGELSLRQA